MVSAHRRSPTDGDYPNGGYDGGGGRALVRRGCAGRTGHETSWLELEKIHLGAENSVVDEFGMEAVGNQ